jgi:hypothetical protein
MNAYALLDTGSDDDDSESEEDSYIPEGIRIDQHNWANATVA